MSRSWPSYLTIIAVAGIAGVALFRTEMHTPVAHAAAAANTGWEYQTISVEVGSLANKLTDLGRDGWEVFSILNTDFKVENEPDGKAHLMTVRLEVTAKRPKS